jgi:hypothetical protein
MATPRPPKVVLSERARYCSDACKQRAYRLRQVDLPAVEADQIRADLRRRGQVVIHTIYECPACEARYLRARRCSDCNRFCRALGLAGPARIAMSRS